MAVDAYTALDLDGLSCQSSSLFHLCLWYSSASFITWEHDIIRREGGHESREEEEKRKGEEKDGGHDLLKYSK